MTQGGWSFLNFSVIENRLRNEPPDVRSRVVAALEVLLDNPTSPDSLPVHPLRGRPAKHYPDRLVVRLPDGWVLTYSVHPDGLMPLAVPLVMAHAMVRLV